MGEVLWHLEYVLQLHEAWLRNNAGDSSVSIVEDLGPIHEGESEEVLDAPNSDTGTQMKTEEDGEPVSRIDRDPMDPMAVGVDEFSQMVNQQGR
ncbi:UNVERIFIED_CONTAM: hypothetical protein Sangu_0859400 [Sesamum angustifolium]|uniref:Uncharacterized protein n=1 Tax=Sesamum angustifolium TaxID=2727405 RepID=A0AAW2PDX5_9LAMI